MKSLHICSNEKMWCIFGIATLLVAPSVMAGDAPPAHKASPDVYKVVAEDKNMRVIEATWQPGQRDNWHSHPAMTSYRLTDCKFRIHTDGGKMRERDKRVGFGSLRDKKVRKHSFENIGSNVCRILIVELKK